MPSLPYMMSLLHPEQPGGLLGVAGGGLSPIQAALASLAAQKPKVQTTATPIAQRPQIQGAPQSLPQATPPAPAASPPPSMPAGPLASPTRMGLLSGGIAALEAGPGSAYTGPGPVIAAALKAGLPAYFSTKASNEERELSREQDKASAAMLKDPGVRKRIGEANARVLEGMTAKAAAPLLKEILGKEYKAGKDDIIKDAGGNTIVEGRRDRKFITGPNGEQLEVPDEGAPKAVTGTKKQDEESTMHSLAVGMFKKPLESLSPEEFNQVHARNLELKHASGTNVNVNGPKLAGPVPAGLDKEREGAVASLETFAQAGQALDLLQQGVVTGTLAPTRLALGNALATLGVIDKDTKDKVKATQQYLATTAQVILAEVGRLGGGLRGLTDKEREWMTQAMAGNLKDQPEAMIGVLKAMQKTSYLLAERYAERQSKIVPPDADPGTQEYYRINLPDAPPSVLWGRMTQAQRDAVIKAGGKAP